MTTQKPTQQPTEAHVKIQELTARKLDLVSQIKGIQAELAKVNMELHQSGADMAVVICW